MNKTLQSYVMLFMAIVSLSLIAQVSIAQPEKQDDLYIYDKVSEISNDNIFKTEGYYNWGTSILKGKDGKYHLFYSRWKSEYKFTGWLTHSEIAHATSRAPAGPWKFKETVLKGRGQEHWDAITAHNPKIKYFEGKYYLYYISTNMGDKPITQEELIETAQTGYKHPNWSILRPNQRTGVAVSNSINGPWKRMDQPLIEPSGPITTLTVNPAIDRGKDGKYYLIVKGDKPNEKRFIRNQAIAVSNSPLGPFKMQEKPVIDYTDTEDVSMWYDKGRDRFYGVFHAHEFIGMVTSPNGIDWKKANEYVLMSKKVKMKDGTILKPDRMERPFVYTENGKPAVLSLAVKKGEESYSIFVPLKNPEFPVPNARQLAWQEAELGVVFHYDLHVFDGKKYGQGQNRIDPVPDYQIFNPEKLDTDQWIKSAKDAGATFAMLTATHETGFALYQSDVNPYSLKALKWRDGKGDIVGDFVNSCRKYGIKPGIYLGIRWNSFLGVHDFKVNGEGEFRENRQHWYNSMVEGMVKEICTRYGELFEIWFDGGADHPDNGAPDVLPIVRRYQPNCLFYHNGQLAEARWGGSEHGMVGDPCWATFPYPATGAGESAWKNIAKDNFKLLKHGDPDGKYWVPAMSDAPLRGYNGRHEWFWEPGDEEHIFPLENLVDMYYKSVGRNSTLILGLTPDPDGLMPEPDVNRLKELGTEIKKRFSDPIANTSGKGTRVYLKLPSTQKFNQLVIQEDIANGERIRAYSVEALINGQWKEVASGQSIGHKRIHLIDEVEASRLRLMIHESISEPIIKLFSIYAIDHK
ncbi:alpha-L-fucosidase [Fulvivirgaceae bacterium BMA12]|uniref:alpha-L-fucosidase n=1 Tax=Agaribacillus aureus TaxID=3051825 RepID=A0ABT8LB06_9BACT|nr:alpha-L-fucosidase [Fulvivirgaceae bacterium BMA12]